MDIKDTTSKQKIMDEMEAMEAGIPRPTLSDRMFRQDVKLNAYEQKLKNYEKQLQDMYTAACKDLEEKRNAALNSKQQEQYRSMGGNMIAVQRPITFQCPECGHQYHIEVMADRLRVRFRHGTNSTCSHDMTEFYRPFAQFTEFI